MDVYYGVIDLLRAFLLLVGSVIIFIGIARAAFESPRGEVGHVARRIGINASLGLEFFVGAGLLNLTLNRTSWAAVGAAALTIVVRKLLTFSLNRSTV